eukprot:COSAG04_NODE_2402_length_4203_cov_6.597466_7_plen_72_part_00
MKPEGSPGAGEPFSKTTRMSGVAAAAAKETANIERAIFSARGIPFLLDTCAFSLASKKPFVFGYWYLVPYE